jgi:hypothetical protein
MNQGFSNYFCLMIEGSGPGSIPLTSGSGSGYGSERPKNMWILWIRFRIHIRIREAQKHVDPERYSSQPIAYKPSIVCSMDQITNRIQC